jgi:tRNA 2-thiouridine synthesizing protein E
MSLNMPEMSMQEVIHPFIKNPSFPCAPPEWSSENAERDAQQEGITLREDHWETIRILQECLSCTDHLRGRALHDALNEKFHIKGGLRYLYDG